MFTLRNRSEKKRILVVDDEYANRLLLRAILEQDYLVEEAVSGEESIVKTGSFDPDLILMDIIMTGMSGIEATEKITRDPRYSDIPIIMVTSKGDPRDIRSGLEAGAVDYLRKPFSEVELKARVASSLKISDLVQQLIRSNREKEDLIIRLQEAMSNVKTLTGLLPICSQCKKIRDEEGYWKRVEEFFESALDVDFTHSYCGECARELYPELFNGDQPAGDGFDPGMDDPSEADSDKDDPGKADSDKDDPGKAEPGKADPGKADPGRDRKSLSAANFYNPRAGR